MTSRSINNYRIFCNTESLFVNVWSTDIPSVCPNNIQHQIDTNSISVVDTISSNAVNIIQYKDGIQGLYRVLSRSMFIPARQTISEDTSYDIPVSILSINFITTTENSGDIVNCYVAPNTIIGKITKDINNGDKVINVSPTVITNVKRGYIINITNGSKIINMGECTDINPVTNTITCNSRANDNINLGSIVQITIHNIKDFILGPPSSITFNNKTLQTTLIAKNTILRMIYQNNSDIDTTFYTFIEFLY